MSTRIREFLTPRWRIALAILVLLPLVALGNWESGLPYAPAAAPAALPIPGVADDAWQSRGRVVHQEPYDPPLEDDSVLGEAWRAVYSSVSGVDGKVREVSGAFFVPPGDPPEGGWPVISLAHGTTGIGNYCGPTQQPDLQDYAPFVESLLTAEYAVALSDYEGLGESGSHPYLEPLTGAFNVVDAVRAMREVVPTVSARWVALGYSQGGQAVWAADELNDYYGDGLELVGSVALAPAANVTGVADLAWTASLTEDQRAIFPLLVVGVARYTEGLDEDAFLHGAAAERIGALSRCESTDPRPQSTQSTPNLWERFVDDFSEWNDLWPATRNDVIELREALRRVALPQRPLTKPMLVLTGERDSLVLAPWVRSAVSSTCALGGTIEYQQLPDADHRDIVWKPRRTIMRWIADRFAGVPAPSNCDSLPR